MRRRLFNVLVVLSLVMLTLIVLLASRSTHRIDLLGYRTAGGFELAGASHKGTISLHLSSSLYDTHGMHFESFPTRGFRWLGFGIASLKSGGVAVYFPHWVPAVLCALGPLFRNRWRVQRLEAQQRGLCLTCGYDLRASPERCPECGTDTPRLHA